MGWSDMTAEERSAEMIRRRKVAQQNKAAKSKRGRTKKAVNGSTSLFAFIDDPQTALVELDEKISFEQQCIYEAKATIQVSEEKISRLNKLRELITPNKIVGTPYEPPHEG